MVVYPNATINTITDGFSQSFRNVSESMRQDYNVSVIGAGIEEVLTDPALFNEYRNLLLQGVTADEAENLSVLMDGARTTTLANESMSGITPIAAMTWPMLRKFWPRVGVIHAIPTQAVKSPVFDISYKLSYILDENNNKQYLPEAIRGSRGVGMGERPTLASDPIALPTRNEDLLSAVGASKALNDEIDIDFYLVGATVTCLDNAGGNAEDKPVVLNVKMDSLSNMLSAEVSAAHTDGTVTTDVIFGSVDRGEGTLTASSVSGSVKNILIKGYLSTVNNNRVENVGFDIKTRRFNIPTGPKLAAPLPTEWLQDLQAMYQVDGFLQVQETMSSFLAQRLDYEADAFLNGILQENEINPEYKAYKRSFSVRPSASYSGSPKDWRDEIRTVIDHMSTSMKNDSSFTTGRFNLLGNALDIDLIPNNDWSFNSAVSDERAGVSVDYNIGATSGSNRYKTVSTPNVNPGKIKVIYQPNDPEQMTAKFYPYAYNVESSQTGYRNPNSPNVPSVQVSRRHQFAVMTPLIGEIEILSNDGSLPE